MEQRSVGFAKLAVGAVLVTALLPGCGPKAKPDPDPAACKVAMEQQLVDAVKGSTAVGTKPRACDGLTNQQLADIATQILGEEIGEPSPS